ncbi:MAG: hypothetical protein FJ029_06890 [Actinobacteria bacterium]|nr:hypothetical protein [Actinomycetota bacterium]
MYSRDELSSDGFEGFVSVRELGRGAAWPVRSAAGVYAVLRMAAGMPEFLASNRGGRFKRKDPTKPVSELLARWVPGAQVLYFGKADNLDERIRALLRFAAGRPVAHWGGRLLWQVQGHLDFIVCWKRTAQGIDPEAVESHYLRQFQSTYGKLPFANLRG